ncbi:17741_t:CDS:1, partial [Cetraspora pellucida]
MEPQDMLCATNSKNDYGNALCNYSFKNYSFKNYHYRYNKLWDSLSMHIQPSD